MEGKGCARKEWYKLLRATEELTDQGKGQKLDRYLLNQSATKWVK